MGIPVFILGDSGSGKSASMRNMNPNDFLLIQVVKKPLPFRDGFAKHEKESGTKSLIVTDSHAKIIDIIRKTRKTVIVIDDFQYVMSNEFMRRGREVGFTKFTEMAQQVWELITAAQLLPDDKIVYFLSHTSTDDSGFTRCKTIGKLLDEKITLEGLFTIVMRSMKRDSQHVFTTANNGHDTVKTPMGMFENEVIENDLNEVTKTIKSYYSLEN